MNTSIKTTTSFWVISVIALLWNLMGVGAYLGQALMTDEMKKMIPEDQLTILENTPIWATAAFAIAVWFGVLGAVLLLFRKKIAKMVFLISLLGVLVQLIYNIFMTNAIEAFGVSSIIQPLVTVSISVFLVWFANNNIEKGVLK
ncbi:hypothetical protein DUT90_07810 [Polaribacter sp. WD7]|uniref:hypothetical protein n=1 Tax=Polaribacter sp. WD7 TaxID=2269061 RepID=UPI000DF23DB2|nr:hypothetical protein [Polaribacter sp. WD7]RCS27012.1 hypothetical protein DUT90_07810 [Polaribacter sp. WD7]